MASIRVTDRDDWFDVWYEDKRSMIAIMVRNMASDLENGYDPLGNTIRNQQEMIEQYRNQFDMEMDTFKGMDEMAVNRWCFYDMKKRGVID